MSNDGVVLVLARGRVLQSETNQIKELDLAIDCNGRIAALAPKAMTYEGARIIDLAGRLVVPGLVDAHQHLDKSRTRRLVSNSAATLEGASAGYRGFAANVTRDDILARAERTLDVCLAHGTVAIRSHTNIESDTCLRGVEAMVALRERCRDRLTLQVVAHLTNDAPRRLGDSRKWLTEAIKNGVDAIGGVPQYAEEPLAFIDLLFGFAERSGLPLDMHIDEHLDRDRLLFDVIIDRTRAHGMRGRVTAGHCCALSAVPKDEAKRIIAGFAEAGISVITLPAANLFLQGRGTDLLPPRGLTRVRELAAAGVRIAAASDNIQDPFIPTGSGDLLEVGRWTLLSGQLGFEDLHTAFNMISSLPADIIGLGSDWGIRLGARADLLITDSEDVEDLVATGSTQRAVLVGGRLVSGTL